MERIVDNCRITVILYKSIRTIIPQLCPNAKLFYVETKNDFLGKIQMYQRCTDIFVNLYDKDDALIHYIVSYLEDHQLPYTGCDPAWCNPSRETMKMICNTASIKTPSYAFFYDQSDIDAFLANQYEGLKFPMFIKTFLGGDSQGIDQHSKVNNEEELVNQAQRVLAQYNGVLIEEFIDGREFSVLVAGSLFGKKDGEDENIRVYEPVEFDFRKCSYLGGQNYLNELCKSAEIVNEYWYEACTDQQLAGRLKELAHKLFLAAEVTGYLRYDFRYDANENEFYLLDMNPYCSLFFSYNPIDYSTADQIIHNSGCVYGDFLEFLIELGLERYQRNRKNYTIKYIDHNRKYGMFAAKDLEPNEIIYTDELNSLRLVSRKYLQDSPLHPSIKDIYLNHYSWQVSDNLFVYYASDPELWKPVNHSCEPNAIYKHLTTIAKRHIRKGEEIVLDYSTFVVNNSEPVVANLALSRSNSIDEGSLDETTTGSATSLSFPEAAPFECNCGSDHCRKSEIFFNKKKMGIFPVEESSDYIQSVARTNQLLNILNQQIAAPHRELFFLHQLPTGDIILQSKQAISQSSIVIELGHYQAQLSKIYLTDRSISHKKKLLLLLHQDSLKEGYDFENHWLQFLQPLCLNVEGNLKFDQENQAFVAMNDIGKGDCLSFRFQHY